MTPARAATSVIFLVHGLLVAAWVSRIPDVQRQLQLSEGVLGSALFAIAIGSLLAMPLTGALVTRFGSRAVTGWTSLAFCVAVAAIPLGSNAFNLSLLLAGYGAAAGAMDVAMNAQGVTVQSRMAKSVMSSFHALFSIGGMLGAFAGGQLARLGVPVHTHLAGTAVLGAILAISAWPRMLGLEHEGHADAGPHFSLPRGPVIALGALGFSILLAEGAIADWIAIFLRDWRSAGPAMSAAGYAVFSAAMSVGRLFGDTVTDSLGPVRTVRWGSALAAAGLAIALVNQSIFGALAAFLVVGLGYAAIIPNVFAASARIPGVPPGAGIASVTTMGYFGFLVGPPAIGWLAEWLGLQSALALLVLLSAIAAFLANSLRPRTPG